MTSAIEKLRDAVNAVYETSQAFANHPTPDWPNLGDASDPEVIAIVNAHTRKLNAFTAARRNLSALASTTECIEAIRDMLALDPVRARVAELEAALALLVDAARKVARWANPGDEVCSPEADVMAREADELRAVIAELERK